MPLDAYRAKRNFRTTPEPPGRPGVGRRSRARVFAVQKHLASRLHYDLRLEHEGVLWSWAVPKGPSLDPRDRRLAVHVEDHPLEYGDFEGVIPDGYGAGVVMLWDRGSWIPEVPDAGAALEKGDLKFRLDGFKLKGSWALVRTRGGDGRSWLLIKHRDDWAASREELDITTFAPRSVKSDADFVGILAADQPAVWLSRAAGRGGPPGAALSRIIERALTLGDLSAPAALATPPRPPARPKGGRAASPTRKTSVKRRG